jgi:tetratricopeptide (TPR) repeat protein
VPKRSIPMLTAIFLMLTFSSCTCIYFNTFYNIRKDFGAAEKSRKEAGRDKAGGGEVKQYNDAIARASRVLERHPTSSYVDDALYIIGTSYYYLGEYSKATRKFKELFANYPQSEYVPRSRLLMAKAKLKMNEEAEAVVIFEEIFQKEKNKEMKAEAARSLGEYYFENRDYEKSNDYFMALVDSLGNQTERLNALIYVADGYFDMFSLQSAIDDYNTALKQNPDTLQLYHIMFRLAECDIYLSRVTEGIEKLSELADNEVYYDSLAPIRLKMAEGYEWEGDFNSAIDTYERVIDENPRRDPAAIAYYRLGLIYQYDYENLSKARAYYQKSREERSSSPVAEDATRRASKLALLEQYTQTGKINPEADSTQEIDLKRLDE